MRAWWHTPHNIKRGGRTSWSHRNNSKLWVRRPGLSVWSYPKLLLSVFLTFLHLVYLLGGDLNSYSTFGILLGSSEIIHIKVLFKVMSPVKMSALLSTHCLLSFYFTPRKIKLPKNSKKLNVIPNTRNKEKENPI